MAADELVGFLVRGLVDDPDAVKVQTIEGESSVVYEVRVGDGDFELVQGEGGETMQAIKAVVSAGSGQKKPVVELLQGDEPGTAEE